MSGIEAGRRLVRGAVTALAILSLASCAHRPLPGTCSGGALKFRLSLADGSPAPLPPEQRERVISMDEQTAMFPSESHGVYRCAPVTGECRSITVDPKLYYMALPQNFVFHIGAANAPPDGLVVRADFEVLERPLCQPEF